jgi:hypothetical protein
MPKTLEEPVIIGYGRQFVGEYQEGEFLESFRRAFAEKPDGTIILDSIRAGQKFLAASAAWAVDQGLLEHCETDDSDEQCTVYSFRLTEAGKARLGFQ